MMKKCLSLLIATAALTLAGCATDSSTNTSGAKSAPATATKEAPKQLKGVQFLIPVEKVNAIAKGMKAETVRELLGSPTAVAPFSSNNITGEIWTYRVSYSETVTQIPTTMRDVPGWDPIGNRPMTLQEPVYQLQHLRTYQTLELLIVDGRLIQRKPGFETDRAFY